jgi:hypothetical protein
MKLINTNKLIRLEKQIHQLIKEIEIDIDNMPCWNKEKFDNYREEIKSHIYVVPFDGLWKPNLQKPYWRKK